MAGIDLVELVSFGFFNSDVEVDIDLLQSTPDITAEFKDSTPGVNVEETE